MSSCNCFLCEYEVAQFKTSRFHPQSNGCLERSHRTLKDMLKVVGETFPGDWDQLLPWILFTYREVPVDIVFWRNIKGVLQLIKNFWLKDDMPVKVRSKNVIDYVLQLRDRIRSSLEIVNAHEKVAKTRSKVLYDRNTRPVSYKEGELIIIIIIIIITSTICNWRRNTAMPLQGRLTVN